MNASAFAEFIAALQIAGVKRIEIEFAHPAAEEPESPAATAPRSSAPSRPRNPFLPPAPSTPQRKVTDDDD